MSALNDGVVLAQTTNQNQSMPDQDSSVDTTNDQGTQNDEEDDPPIVIRSRRRRQRPINPAPPLGSLEEDVIEEEREEIGNEEMVLLFPRLVLDRYSYSSHFIFSNSDKNLFLIITIQLFLVD